MAAAKSSHSGLHCCSSTYRPITICLGARTRFRCVGAIFWCCLQVAYEKQKLEIISDMKLFHVETNVIPLSRTLTRTARYAPCMCVRLRPRWSKTNSRSVMFTYTGRVRFASVVLWLLDTTWLNSRDRTVFVIIVLIIFKFLDAVVL